MSDAQAPSGDGQTVDQVRDMIAGVTSLLAGYTAQVGVSALSLCLINVLVSCYQDPSAAWEDMYDDITDNLIRVLARNAAAKVDDKPKDYQPE